VKKSSSLGTPEAFNSNRIGVLPGTTNELAVQRKLPKAKPVYFQTWAEGYQALEKGSIDGLGQMVHFCSPKTCERSHLK
jgi:polar amino acid transport system substrate-binding protein